MAAKVIKKTLEEAAHHGKYRSLLIVALLSSLFLPESGKKHEDTDTELKL